MQYVKLGRTGLEVSVAGIGTGGPSQVGKRQGKSPEESVSVIRTALDQGINFIDTAEAYGTEDLVGRAIADVPRDSVVVSTKLSTWDVDESSTESVDVRSSVETSLRKLQTDYIDVYHLHAVTADTYPVLLERVVPVLQELRQEGKIRFLGITERFHADPGHRMLPLALSDDIWDVVMVGFNILNQSARERVLPATIEKDVGVLAMFAVRLALSRPERLREVVAELIDREEISGVDPENPLGFLDAAGTNTVEAAYRFVRHEPGIHVTLTGTGSANHLTENVASIQMPPLPDEIRERLRALFGGVDSVSAQ